MGFLAFQIDQGNATTVKTMLVTGEIIIVKSDRYDLIALERTHGVCERSLTLLSVV